MKIVAITVLALGTILPGCTQNISQSNVPSLVKNAFQQKYPTATDVEWEKHASLYNVEFEINNIDHELWIDSQGNITKHKEDLSLSNVPVQILDAVAANYKTAQIDNVDKIEENNKTYYIIELEKWSGDKYIQMNEDGTLVK